MTTDVIAQLLLGFACLIVLGIALGFAYVLGVFAAAPRRSRHVAAVRAAQTARPLTPARSPAAVPVRVVRGELER